MKTAEFETLYGCVLFRAVKMGTRSLVGSCSGSSPNFPYCCGDVAETCQWFRRAMAELRLKFDRVFWVPGNHDLWLRIEPGELVDSVEKLKKLLLICKELGVETEPTVLEDDGGGSLGIIPLYSWHHTSFNKEVDLKVQTGFKKAPPFGFACKDFKLCRWPGTLDDQSSNLAMYFDKLNYKNAKLQNVSQTCTRIISFSHFVPRFELIPEKRMLRYPDLAKISGPDFLEQSIRRLAAAGADVCHVFGHTHIPWDGLLDGVRYVQAPLGLPKEQKYRGAKGREWLPCSLYECGNFTGIHQCYWLEFYLNNSRKPEIMDIHPSLYRIYKLKDKEGKGSDVCPLFRASYCCSSKTLTSNIGVSP